MLAEALCRALSTAAQNCIQLADAETSAEPVAPRPVHRPYAPQKLSHQPTPLPKRTHSPHPSPRPAPPPAAVALPPRPPSLTRPDLRPDLRRRRVGVMPPEGHPGPALQTATLAELEARANLRPNGKPRVPPVRLADCELLQLIQYRCDVEDPAAGGGGSSSSSSSSSSPGGNSQAGSDNEGDGASAVAAARRLPKSRRWQRGPSPRRSRGAWAAAGGGVQAVCAVFQEVRPDAVGLQGGC